MARGKPPLGHPRYGGRIKGTPNRCTAAVASKLEVIFASFEPLMEMRLIAESKDTLLDIKVSLLKELAQYQYPKKRAIEVDATVKESFTLIINGA